MELLSTRDRTVVSGVFLAFLLILVLLWHQQFRRDRVTEESTSKTIEGLGFVSNLKLTILYDNNPYNSSVTAAWGFSCLIQTEATTVLFDTGGDGHILLENMARLGIDASKVDVVVLSHIHSDHVGGLAAILEKNNRMRMCLPSSFADWFKLDIKRYRCEVIEVSNGTKISKGVATTGELNRGIKEQAVLLNTQKGLIVITGCAHPGIVNIARIAKELTGTSIHLIIGGFHMAGLSAGKISSIIEGIKSLGVEQVGPCHCSGDLARKMFKDAYGEKYVDTGVGRIIELKTC